MRFKNLEELVKYIVNEPINLEYTDVQFAPYEEPEHKDEPKGDEGKLKDDKPIDTPVEENFEAKISSLYGNPEVVGSFSEENILYVESVEGSRDFCGAGKVNVFDREIMTNLCESDGTAYVRLTIDINGKILENVMFKLKASDTQTKNKIQIKKELLND